jgi:hypothetical protein
MTNTAIAGANCGNVILSKLNPAFCWLTANITVTAIVIIKYSAIFNVIFSIF